MTRTLVLEAYFAAGIATAAWLSWRRDSWAMRAAAIPLWPFLLPALLGASGEPPLATSDADARLDVLSRQVAESWARGPAASVEGDRERLVIDGFIARLRSEGRRIAELEAAQAHAPPRAQASLRRMAETSATELAAGTELLEELLAQLVLLRFASSASVGRMSDRDRIEELLVRIESVVTVQTSA